MIDETPGQNGTCTVNRPKIRTRRKRWRVSFGRKGVNRVTVYERPDTAGLYIEYWEKGKRVRRTLSDFVGHEVTDKSEAEHIAAEYAESLSPRQRPASQPLKKPPNSIAAGEVGDMPLGRLLARRIKHDPLCGVYILRFRSEIVYIGESSDIHARLNHHRRILPVRWDEVFYLSFEKDEDRFVAERTLIERFQPIGNKSRENGTTRPTAEGPDHFLALEPHP
jgi:hypothetical protein